LAPRATPKLGDQALSAASSIRFQKDLITIKIHITKNSVPVQEKDYIFDKLHEWLWRPENFTYFLKLCIYLFSFFLYSHSRTRGTQSVSQRENQFPVKASAGWVQDFKKKQKISHLTNIQAVTTMRLLKKQLKAAELFKNRQLQ
jgi:hypothetical protein